MAHPSGILVDIVGIESPDRGRSCEEHTVCGAVLELDTVVRFRAEQIDVDGEEQTALAVYWVTDGIDRCRVGFLRRHLLKHKKDYDGKLAQIVDTCSCQGAARGRRLRGLGRPMASRPSLPTATGGALTSRRVLEQ